MKRSAVTKLLILIISLSGMVACAQGPSNGVNLPDSKDNSTETSSQKVGEESPPSLISVQNNHEIPQVEVSNQDHPSDSTDSNVSNESPDTGNINDPQTSKVDKKSKKEISSKLAKTVVNQMKEDDSDTTDDSSTATSADPICGNNICNSSQGETYTNCPQDCHTGGGGGGGGGHPRAKMLTLD